MSPRKRHRTITTNMAAYILFYLCGSNRNNQPNNANIVATTMTIGVILATNKPVSRFFSFGLFFPAIILCFPPFAGRKKSVPQTHPACSISDCWHKTFQVTENRDTICLFVSITWTRSFYSIFTIAHLQTVCKYPRKRFLQKPNPVTCPLRRALNECAAAQLRGGA